MHDAYDQLLIEACSVRVNLPRLLMAMDIYEELCQRRIRIGPFAVSQYILFCAKGRRADEVVKAWTRVRGYVP